MDKLVPIIQFVCCLRLRRYSDVFVSIVLSLRVRIRHLLDPSTGALKPQSNETSYSNTMTGTLAVDGWAVTFGTARRRLGGVAQPPLRCTKCNVQSTHQRPVYKLHFI